MRLDLEQCQLFLLCLLQKKPIDQGFVQTVGVYFDTLVLCSLTGFVLLMYDIDLNLYEGCDLIIDVFNQILGVFGKYASVFFLLSFCFSNSS